MRMVFIPFLHPCREQHDNGAEKDEKQEKQFIMGPFIS